MVGDIEAILAGQHACHVAAGRMRDAAIGEAIAASSARNLSGFNAAGKKDVTPSSHNDNVENCSRQRCHRHCLGGMVSPTLPADSPGLYPGD
jgi:hypothetical protein